MNLLPAPVKLFLVVLFTSVTCLGQQSVERLASDTANTHTEAQNLETDTVRLQVNKKRLTSLIAAEGGFYVAGITYLQFVWYRDHERVPFHFYNDTKGYLQIDKLGHVYGAYIESYIGYHWLKSAGVSRKKALLFGGTLGLVLQTPIEVFDGLYEGYGFSWADMAANAVGSGLVIGNELLFQEQLVKYKFSYWESPYAEMAHGYLGDNTLERVFLDYNGHTYWLSAPVKKILPAANPVPEWLNLAAGYSANGMFGEFRNRQYYRGKAIPETQRYRQFLLSLDVDWTKIKTDSKLLKIVFTGMTFVKLPFPTLEYSSKGQWKGHWLYY
ncbi:DUF2279 domain-containing protein [Rufibacter roseus]|uniref:DUF2279 domain-containing protein n=1 Tax=Rufibacter roseus TaxID=1567108 RepID=A0ABW2DHU5_9BACT|nr:DUF2279 domain-containing protein [Rufibacter roseus]